MRQSTTTSIAIDDHGDDRYIVISSDCHGGGDIHDYRPYLDGAVARRVRRLGRRLRDRPTRT
ncbi:MAG: hypothetical protein QM784_19750 [Polyangiaceae bacterium]